MGDVDITLRHITQQHPEALLQALALPLDIEVVGWRDTQLTALPIERRPDKGLAVRVGGELRTLVVEIRYDLRGAMGPRILQAQAMFAPEWPDRSSSQPPRIASLVIVLTGRQMPWPREQAYSIGWPELGFCGAHYYVDAVYQRTVAELCARGSVFWLAFTPLARDATGPALQGVVRALRARLPNEDERADLYAVMLVLADVDPWGYNLRQEIEAMIETDSVDMLEVSRTLRNAFEKGIEKGKSEGRNEGIREGIEKGIERMLRRLFARRVGRELTQAEQQALSARVQAGDPEAIEDRALTLEGERLASWLLDPNAT